MRILILVQSTDNPFYQPLIQSQKETWDSIQHPDIDVVYYKNSLINEGLNDNTLEVLHNNRTDNAFFVLMKAIRFMLRKGSWDYIIKTDNSVYVNKEATYNLLLNKPREKYFGGFPITHDKLSEESKKDFPPDIKFLWGEFMIMSRDCAVYLVDKFNKAPLKGLGCDDVIVSHLLENYCTWDESINIGTDENDLSHCSYRVRRANLMISPMFIKPDNIKEIISNDISIMHKIHNTIINGKDKDKHREVLSEEAQN